MVQHLLGYVVEFVAGGSVVWTVLDELYTFKRLDKIHNYRYSEKDGMALKEIDDFKVRGPVSYTIKKHVIPKIERNIMSGEE